MEEKEIIVFFGAAGGGLAYCQNTNTLPDIFVDNDSTKWGTFINGKEVFSPDILSKRHIKKVVITSGYVKSIHPQILSYGINEHKVQAAAKSLLGLHPFESYENRKEVARKVDELSSKLVGKWNIVAVGGTALGFVRDGDFIHWDIDLDFFAPTQCKEELFNLLDNLNCSPEYENESIKAIFRLENGISIPFSIDFFDGLSDTFIDRFEDYSWEWPTKMFTMYSSIEIHGFLMNVPSSASEYLSKVYGKSWSVPNPEFSYSDYAGKIS